MILTQRHNTTLKAFLTKCRRKNATPDGPMTWDEIARRLWVMTDETPVRESVISYARRFGLAPDRVLHDTEEIDPAESLQEQHAA